MVSPLSKTFSTKFTSAGSLPKGLPLSPPGHPVSAGGLGGLRGSGSMGTLHKNSPLQPIIGDIKSKEVQGFSSLWKYNKHI